MTKTLTTTLGIAAFCAFAVGSVAAQDADCPRQDPTITALDMCVEHAYQAGHIDNGGIVVSLLNKLAAADRAVAADRMRVAINLLEAFVLEVQAQAGGHIAEPHATEMAGHALDVMEHLTR